MLNYDVIGIGNAIVDVLIRCDEAFLKKENLQKGAMILIDAQRAKALYEASPPARECSGGSAANTLAGLANLGVKTGFIGKVKDDQLGAIFKHDMTATGTAFLAEPSTTSAPTARCLVYVTEDGERTMATYLGACTEVSVADVNDAAITSAEILYIEGYLWDTPHAKAAIRKAIGAAKQAGAKVAFTLSDVFCVERHRADFLKLIAEDFDILFANEAELCALYETDFESAVEQLKNFKGIAAITRSEKGCVVVQGGTAIHAASERVEKVVDATGAGDLFASGFLYGLLQGWLLEKAAALGNACAARIIQQLGARSVEPLKSFAA